MSALNGFVTFDIETTTKTYLGRKASPYCPDNHIVAAGYKLHKQRAVGDWWGHNKTASQGWLASVLVEHRPRFLVGMNIKFDILHFIVNSPVDYDAYMQWVTDGGQLWDIQLAEYLLEGMVPEAQMMSLDDIAPKYGGELKIDEVKAMWQAGIDTPDIPRKLLMDYLLGRLPEGDEPGHMGDCDNTEVSFLGQLRRAKEKDQLKSLQLNMGALVATIEMEKNGLKIDRKVAEVRTKELEVLRDKLKQDMAQYIPKDLPFEFNWRSRFHLSALVFGGSVGYQQRVHQRGEDGELAYAKKKAEAYVLANGEVCERGLYDQCLAAGVHAEGSDDLPERVIYSSGKKKGTFKTKQIDVPDLDKPKLKYEDFEFKFPGYASPLKSWKTDTPGVYTTKSEVMEELAETTDVPFLVDFGKLQSTIKDLGTYYISIEYDDEGEVKKAKGMLTLVQPHDDIVHGNIGMVGTVTARFNHSNPNMGNLPRSGTSEVKMMFVSRFSGGSIISSDFTSLEVYCQANLSLDPQLIKDLRLGLDMHCLRLSLVENKKYEDVLLLCKGDKKQGVLPEHEWEQKRTDIKVYSFQTAYGAGVPKIARQVKRAEDDVQAWADADKARYPKVYMLADKVTDAAKASKWATGHHTVHPTAQIPIKLHRGEYRTWDGKRYVFMEGPTPDFLAKRGTLQGFSPTEIKNYPVQGLGGEWMKAAMWLAVRLFYRNKNFGGLALLINTVHDALYADSDPSVRRKAGVAIHACMLAASDFMEFFFEYKVRVPVPSETHWGASMFNEERFEDNELFEKQAGAVRIWLRNTYMDGFTPSFID